MAYEFSTEGRHAHDGMVLACGKCSCGWLDRAWYRGANMASIHAGFAHHFLDAHPEDGLGSARVLGEPAADMNVVSAVEIGEESWFAVRLPEPVLYDGVSGYKRLALYRGRVHGFDSCSYDAKLGYFTTAKADLYVRGSEG